MSLNLIRRLIKGAPLTAAEHDGNLDKLEDAIEAREATGAAAAAVSAHTAAAEPHPNKYASAAQGALAATAIQPGNAALSDAREWSAATVSQAEAEAGSLTSRRAFTPQRVFQAVAAWWAGSEFATKLAGIASGATANASDAQLRDRATHTGTQAVGTITGLGTAATLNHGTAAGSLVRLDPTTGLLPAVDGSQLTGLPTGGGTPSPGIAPWNAGSGAMIAPNNITAAPGPATAVAGAVEYHQVFIPEATTALALICRTGTTYAGTSDVMLGIYANAASRPAGKIADASLQITASGAATYAVTISQPLSPGWHWLSFLAVSVGATPSFIGCTANVPGVGGGFFTELTPSAAQVTSVRQTGQSSLPATAGSLTTSTVARAVAFLGV
jgi:hypothetical protein